MKVLLLVALVSAASYWVGFWMGYLNRHTLDKLAKLNRKGKLTLRKAIQVITK